jgi:PhzF family phenazine biosynthesis protein
MNCPFQLVDVFHEGPLSGNPLAVVQPTHALSTAAMQQLTRWLNFSETAFLLPPTCPEADYRVRIFTLDREIPFAGHPTLGTCHVWWQQAGRLHMPLQVVQECGIGLVTLHHQSDCWAFKAPPLIKSGPVDENHLQRIARFLNIDRSRILDAQWADNGPGWMVVRMASAEDVLALTPAAHSADRVDLGVVGPHPVGHPSAYELRAFLNDSNGHIHEDPVTGSLHASTAQWLLGSGLVQAPYIASQGSRRGRQGRVFISQDDSGSVWVGGQTTTYFEGLAHLPDSFEAGYTLHEN